VHSSLVIYSRDQLQPGLPGELFARVEERIYVENEGGEARTINPDVRVVEHARNGGVPVAFQGEMEVAEPYVLHLENEPITETFIEIRDIRNGNRVVTVIEFLSPTNKIPGSGRDLYCKKQNELLAGKVSLVEIDLVRAGRSAFSIAPHEIPAHIRAAYHAVVRRGWQWEKAAIYPFSLRERLPAFHIPLRETDRPVALNLQPLIDQCYLNGRYATIDYRKDAEPSLEGPDAAWADALLRAAGKRQ
jgi:hypothetical protein